VYTVTVPTKPAREYSTLQSILKALNYVVELLVGSEQKLTAIDKGLAQYAQRTGILYTIKCLDILTVMNVR